MLTEKWRSAVKSRSRSAALSDGNGKISVPVLRLLTLALHFAQCGNQFCCDDAEELKIEKRAAWKKHSAMSVPADGLRVRIDQLLPS